MGDFRRTFITDFTHLMSWNAERSVRTILCLSYFSSSESGAKTFSVPGILFGFQVASKHRLQLVQQC